MWNWKWEQKKLSDDTKKQAKCGYPNWTLTMTLEQGLINYSVLALYEYIDVLGVHESTFNPKDSAAGNKSCFIVSLVHCSADHDSCCQKILKNRILNSRWFIFLCVLIFSSA